MSRSQPAGDLQRRSHASTKMRIPGGRKSRSTASRSGQSSRYRRATRGADTRKARKKGRSIFLSMSPRTRWCLEMRAESALGLRRLLAMAVDEAPFGGFVVISGGVSNGGVDLHFRSISQPGVASLIAELATSLLDAAKSRACSKNPRPAGVGEILSAHGGRMKTMPSPGEGSRFEIQLPVV